MARINSVALKNRLIKEAAKFGGKVEVSKWGEDGAERTLTCDAPDGMQWVDGGCLQMVHVYYLYDTESISEAYETMISRVQAGTEPIDYKLNP